MNTNPLRHANLRAPMQRPVSEGTRKVPPAPLILALSLFLCLMMSRGFGAMGDLHLGVALGIGLSDQSDCFEKNFVSGQFRLETPMVSAELEWVHGIQVGLMGGWVGSWNLVNEELSNAGPMAGALQMGASLGWRGALGRSGMDLIFLASGRHRGEPAQPWELGVEAGLMEKGVGYRLKAWYVLAGSGDLASRVGVSAQLVFELGVKGSKGG